MSDQSLEKAYDSYLSAYRAVTAEERRRLLERSVADDVVSINPEGDTCGITDLTTHIEHFQKQKPGAYFTRNKLIAHHKQFLSEWTMYSKDGTAVATAYTYGRFNEQGLITYLIGFFANG